MRKSTNPAPMIAVKLADPKTTVRNPDRAFRPLKAEGELVPATVYWLRRIAQKDVVEIPQDEWKAFEKERLDNAKKAEDEAEAAAQQPKPADVPVELAAKAS